MGVRLTKGARNSEQAAETAVQYQHKVEGIAKEIIKRQKKKGFFKQNTPLLEERRFMYVMPNGLFKQQMVYDRILVWQLSQEDKETFGDTNIIRPAASAQAEEQQAPRGIVVSAGLKALDNMRANGIDLGHIVTFIKHAPWHMKVDTIEGKQLYALILRDGDLTGSEDLARSLTAGEAKIQAQEYDDGGTEHFFVDKKGKTWKPAKPFTDESY